VASPRWPRPRSADSCPLPRRVAFRHELTRRAIADSLPVAQRTLLNGRILSTLTAGRRGGTHHPRDDLARIMHHAAAAGDDAAIVRYGPSAARAAAEDGAHREAVAHYQLILAHRTWFGPPERVELLERAAIECYTVGVRGAEALALQRDAVSLRRDLGDAPALGASLRWLSRIAWFCGDRVLAEATAEEAIAVLTEAGDLASLAMAFSNQAQLDMLADRHHEAIAAAERAIVLARQTENAAALSHALNNLGTARWSLGDPDGRRALAESLPVALAAGQLEHACRAYANVIWGLADLRPAEAETWVREAMDVADRAEHLLFWQYFNVEHAMVALAGARWGEAVMHAARGLDAPGGVRCAGLTVLSRVAVRTGRTVRTGGIGEAGEAEVDETWRLACGIGELQRTGPAAAVVCEDAWLRGDLARVREVAVPVYQEACRLGFPEKAAELELWLARAGEPVARTSPAHPHGLHAAGRWREASAAWRQAGYPYESAAALADSPAVPDRLTALAALDELGARPLAERVRRELRAEGVAAPRGPLATTRENPAHLTRRQLEVISLLDEGLTNAEIADRLVVSVRTVDNHVAAVLEKLGVHSREEAVARGRELGIRTT